MVIETSALIAVLPGEGEEGPRELDVLLRRLPIEAVPVDCDQLEWARYACRVYGKGRHPAALNFGNCFSCALARVTGELLLYKGADFARTDIGSALEGQLLPGTGLRTG